MKKQNIKIFFLLALFFALSVFVQKVQAAGSAINVWTADSNMKIRPQDPQGSGSSFTLDGAKNETVSLQFAITAEAETLNNVDVSLDLPGFTSTIYKEDFMNVITPTHNLGDTGEWPDIMIPKTDTFYGQVRNSFPMTISNISKTYPLVAAFPQNAWGPGHGDGMYSANTIPPSGFTWPFTGTNTSGSGYSYVNNLGTGKCNVSGTYTGSASARYIIAITSDGAIGTATFKWSADNGATFTTGLVTSATPITLGSGISVTFSGAGNSNDFLFTKTGGKSPDEWMFYVSPNRNQPVWVDVQIPKTMAAGNYNGSINVSANGKTTAALPITLNVHDFILPDTSSLPSIFYGYFGDPASGHKLSSSSSHIDELYVADGLRHRISMGKYINSSGGSGNVIDCSSYNESTGAITMNYTNYDNYTAPFMDGSGTTFAPSGITFPGKLTSLNEPNSFNIRSCAVTDNALFLQRARADYIAHLKTKGWFDRFYMYNSNQMDEPGQNQTLWNAEIAYASAWRSAAPDVPLMVTSRLSYATAAGATPYVDTYVSISRDEVSATSPEHVAWRYPRSTYDSFVDLTHTPKHDIWWYSACFEGGGCGNVGGSIYNHFANYSIDSTGLENTMRPWLTRFLDYHGELYYTETMGWDQTSTIDPWDTAYWYGVNGDGQLFYPGRPDKIGGTQDIPLESMRLKLIRNGLQGYEYMHLLDQLGEQGYVNSQLASIMTDVQNFTSDPAALAQVKNNFAARIEADLLVSDQTSPAAPSGLSVM